MPFYFPEGKTKAQRGEITCQRTHSKVSAFIASFCMKRKLFHQMSCCLYSRVKSVMMVVITTPFKAENEFLMDLCKCWLLSKAMDPSDR